MSQLSPGFADPVTEAQRCFRAVLDAMARPGTVHHIDGIDAPQPLSAATAAVILTLVDQETPVWLDGQAAEARHWIAFHCGAPVLDDPANAMFGIGVGLPELSLFSPGTHEAPETSATLIVQVAALGTGRRWRLSGPGLRTSSMLAVDGLPADFAEQWQRNRAQFPCGVDLVLCAGATLTALPRSVTIEEA